MDVLREAGALFDGAGRGEVLVLVLALGLLVELELARAATHLFFMPRIRPKREYLSGHERSRLRNGNC